VKTHLQAVSPLMPQQTKLVNNRKFGEVSDPILRQSAEKLEASFIAEMLKHAGFEKALSQESGFGGDVFSGFLVDIYAERLAENGGFGLADQIYAQLKAHTE